MCPEEDVEAYTTLEIKTGECLVSMEAEEGIRQTGARSTPPTAAVKSFPNTLAAKLAERCFFDLSRPKSVKSTGEKEYMMMFRDSPEYFSSVPKTRQHVFFKVPGRDRSLQGRCGEE